MSCAEGGFTLGTIVALILNLIFPEEAPESAQDPSYSTHEGERGSWLDYKVKGAGHRW